MTSQPLRLNFPGNSGASSPRGCLDSFQPVKGAIVALQWSLRMHGFGTHPPDEFQA
jgi:hypothetical protein